MSGDLRDICRALGHPARRALLSALAQEQCDVSNLADQVKLSQPTVSKHLATLRRAGLVEVRIDGRRRCYSLADAELIRTLLDLLDRLQRVRQS
ncbi:MAG: transcriptional regulator [Acidobacteria bacterium]|nr:MAG: transcriptional regulator [Acidobacteriota bacterium]